MTYKVLGKIHNIVKSVSAGHDVFETIREFPDELVRCTCGGATIQVNSMCSHLMYLFRGTVTQSRKESKESYYAYSHDASIVRLYVELTADGQDFFGWRWAALAMDKK